MTFGFAVDIHFCGGKYHSVAFFGNQAKCGMMQTSVSVKPTTKGCHKNQKSGGDQLCSKSCCENATFLQDSVIKNDVADIDFTLIDLQLESEEIDFLIEELTLSVLGCEKSEPPPELIGHLDPEALQVFVI